MPKLIFSGKGRDEPKKYPVTEIDSLKGFNINGFKVVCPSYLHDRYIKHQVSATRCFEFRLKHDNLSAFSGVSMRVFDFSNLSRNE